MKKIIIVGGGIAGLSAGIYAQLCGFQSEIYEKHSIVGGECTGWNRQGFHIDNCICWLTGTKEGSGLNQVWKQVGALDETVKIIQWDEFFQFETDGITIHVWKDVEKLRKELTAVSIEDKAEIDNLIEAIILAKSVDMPVDKPMNFMNPIELMKMGSSMMGAAKVVNQYGKISVGDYAKRFKHPVLQKFILSYLNENYSAFALIFTFATFCSGNGAVPVGGSVAFAKRMEARYISLGGKVFTGAEVEKIVLAGDHAEGILLKSGEKIVADYVISSCDAMVSFEKLVGMQYMDKKFKTRYDDSLNYPTPSSTGIAFGVDDLCTDIPTNISFSCAPYTVAGKTLSQLAIKNFNYEPSFAPQGKTVITVTIGQYDDDYDYWKSVYQDKKAYKAEKTKLAQTIQSIIETRFPDLCGKMQLLDAFTPITYQRYLNAYHGAYMSFMMTPGGKNLTNTGIIKGLNNVYLTGQWLMPPGGLPGAVATGKFTIQYICKKEKTAFVDH